MASKSNKDIKEGVYRNHNKVKIDLLKTSTDHLSAKQLSEVMTEKPKEMKIITSYTLK